MENRPIRSPHENANGSSARRRSNPANHNQNTLGSNPQPPPQPASTGPLQPVSRPVRVNLLTANGHSNAEAERRRSIVDPDQNFEKFLLRDAQIDPSSLLASPPKSPTLEKLDKIRPPPLRPQHVYAPMPALGALSFLGKKSGDMSNETDFSRLMNGKVSNFNFINTLIQG